VLNVRKINGKKDGISLKIDIESSTEYGIIKTKKSSKDQLNGI